MVWILCIIIPYGNRRVPGPHCETGQAATGETRFPFYAVVYCVMGPRRRHTGEKSRTICVKCFYMSIPRSYGIKPDMPEDGTCIDCHDREIERKELEDGRARGDGTINAGDAC